MKRSTPGGDPHERLRRLLFLVPFLSQKQGAKLGELAKALSIEQSELLQDLDLLAMVGRPPFSPDDYIDVYVEGDRVYLALDQRFSRPPRLTTAEAAALAAAANALAPAAGGAIASALKKIAAALPESAKGAYAGITTQVKASSPRLEELLAPLADAVSKRREVMIDYLSTARHSTEERMVHPYELLLHRGQWYLRAYCTTRKDERLFRVDRIRRLELGEKSFEPKPGLEARNGDLRQRERGRGSEARLRFSRSAAPWIRERFGASASPLPDGRVEVTLQQAQPEWLVPYVLSFGGEAEVLSPPEARAAVARAAQAALGCYQG